MIKDLAKKSRSYRGYDESCAVTREQLEEMVDCTRYAPSSVNIQPLKYYLANEKETVAKIQALTKWARALPELDLPYPGLRPTAWIVICQDLRISDSVPRFQKDVGIAAQTILLAAVEMGLGGCMIGTFNPKEIRSALNLPDTLMPVLLVAIGKPDETVVIREIEEGGDTAYYRGENGVHYVPKRKLKDIIL